MAEGTTETTPQSNPNWLPNWEILVVAMGDIIALIAFAAIGRMSHGLEGTAEGPFLQTMNTALFFIVGWVLAGAGTGHYRGLAMFPLSRVILRTVVTGFVATPIAVGLRAFSLGRLPEPSFLLVALLMSTLFVLGWRIFWTRLRLWWWRELPG